MNNMLVKVIALTLFSGASVTTFANACTQADNINLNQHEQKYTDPISLVNFAKKHSENLIALNTLDSKIQTSLNQQVDFINCLAGNNKPKKLMIAISVDGVSQIRNQTEAFVEEAIAVVDDSL